MTVRKGILVFVASASFISFVIRKSKYLYGKKTGSKMCPFLYFFEKISWRLQRAYFITCFKHWSKVSVKTLCQTFEYQFCWRGLVEIRHFFDITFHYPISDHRFFIIPFCHTTKYLSFCGTGDEVVEVRYFFN